MSGRIRGLAAILAVEIAACQSPVNPLNPPASLNCRNIQHQSGITEICGQPQQIAVLGPFVLEPLIALEIQPTAFAAHAVWHQGDYDNPGQQIPYLGQYVTHPLINLGDAGQPSTEALLKLRPDLILGTQFNNADDYDVLSKIAPTILLQWDDAKTNIQTIAQAVGHPEKAERLLTNIDQRIANGRDSFASFIKENPNVLLLSVDNDLASINMGNSAHGLCSSLLTDLGFNLVALQGVKDNQPGAPVSISLEAVTQVNGADAIILLGFNDDESLDINNFENHQPIALKQAWKDNKLAQSLDANKAGRVYFIPAYLCLGLPGPIGTELYLEQLQEQLLAPASNF